MGILGEVNIGMVEGQGLWAHMVLWFKRSVMSKKMKERLLTWQLEDSANGLEIVRNLRYSRRAPQLSKTIYRHLPTAG